MLAQIGHPGKEERAGVHQASRRRALSASILHPSSSTPVTLFSRSTWVMAAYSGILEVGCGPLVSGYYYLFSFLIKDMT
jgi:hypothetical protein